MSPGTPIRVLIADDHPVVREGLAVILSHEPDILVAGQARNGREAMELFREQRPDVTLIDLSMPDMSGIDVIAALLREDPAARFVVLTIYGGEDDVYRALQTGALAYLLKDAPVEVLLDAIRTVSRGRRYLPAPVANVLANRMAESELTGRELDVLRLLVAGLGNKEIADRLGIGEGTVKTHLNNVLGKLGVHTRTQAILAALHRGIVRDMTAK